MKALLLVCSLALAPLAQAGILVEPYIGFESGKSVSSSPTLGYTFTTSGAVLGGRFGYTFPILFWAGLDYALTTGGKAKSDTSLVSDANYTRSDLYVVAGFDFPILVRAWIGYGLMNEVKSDSGGTTTKLTGGQNTKIGVGFTGLPLVSINLEAYTHKPNKTNGNDFGAGESVNDAGLTLTASLPLDL